MRYLVLALLLTACASSADPAPPATLDTATVEAGTDCTTAVCTRVTYTPDSGGIEAGEGLPHIGCHVSVAGCFHPACDGDHAYCGDAPAP